MRRLEEAKARTHALFANEATSAGSDAPAPVPVDPSAVQIGEHYVTHLDDAIRGIMSANYNDALASLKEAVKVPPKVHISPTMIEGTVDTAELVQQVADSVTPLKQVHDALQWLMVTRGRSQEGAAR
ncbi:MAG: hypothetical protein AB7F82_08925 [Alphaproteobacteria bacterium]